MRVKYPVAISVLVLSALVPHVSVAQNAECEIGVNCPSPPSVACDGTNTFCVDTAPSENRDRLDELLSGYSFPFSVSYPADPVTSSVSNVASCSEFQAAVRRNGTLINVAAGTYNCDLNFVSGANDIDIVMSSNATLNGQVLIDGSGQERIRWTGGNIRTGGGTNSFDLDNVNDFLMDNVVLTGRINEQGTAGNKRIAFINSTVFGDSSLDFSHYASPSNPNGSVGASTGRHQDHIFANMRYDEPDRYGNSTVRLQYMDRTVTVSSVFNGEGYITTGWRIGESSDGLYMADSIVVGRVFANFGQAEGRDITGATFDNVKRYNLAGAEQYFCLCLGTNTGSVSNSQVLTDAGHGLGNPPIVSPFTDGGGNPNVMSWSASSGISEDLASYGATR